MIERRIKPLSATRFLISDGEQTTELNMAHIGGTSYSIQSGSTQETIDLIVNAHSVYVFQNGQSFAFERPDPLAIDSDATEGGDDLIPHSPSNSAF